jgi:nucleoside-diphosphate-sugar epimerase
VVEAARTTDGIDVIEHHRATLDVEIVTAAQLAKFIGQAQPDVVVNAIGATTGDARRMLNLNASFPGRVARAVSKYGPAVRLVHLGSAAEYSRGVSQVPIAEDWQTKPAGHYGETKLRGTKAVLRAAAAGVDAVVLRIFNPVGAGMPVTTALGRAALLIDLALAAGDTEIELGSLDAHRDLLEARDVAHAVLAAAGVANVSDRLLNIGSGRATLMRSAVGQLMKAAGFNGTVRETTQSPRRSHAADWQQADIRAANRVLGWHAQYSLSGAIFMLWRGRG